MIQLYFFIVLRSVSVPWKNWDVFKSSLTETAKLLLKALTFLQKCKSTAATSLLILESYLEHNSYQSQVTSAIEEFAFEQICTGIV